MNPIQHLDSALVVFAFCLTILAIFMAPFIFAPDYGEKRSKWGVGALIVIAFVITNALVIATLVFTP